MSQNKLISVIIAVYNCESYLSAAIDSILEQDYQSLEIIVVDDGSTDNTNNIIKNYPSLRYIFQEHTGPATAKNTGIKAARGDYLAFLDADDLWLPNKLTSQMAEFRKNPDLDMVFGHVQQFYSPDVKEQVEAKIYCPKDPVPGFSTVTLLIKRDSFLKVGFLHEQKGQFIDWFARAQENGLKSLLLPDVVTKRRLHLNNYGIHAKDKYIDYVRILKAAIERRRNASK
jgi:glycosyltransferase involved in cell wall biosynthesis